MKNAAQIIDSIQNSPRFSKLSHYKCIKIVQSMFTPPVQKMISFAYIKNRTLFFVFSHPVGKQEFDNSIQTIKSALKFYTPPECHECEEIIFDDIKAFVTHTPRPREIPLQETQQSYPERSSGEFDINVKDEKLVSIIKSIQEIIKKNR